MIRRDGGISYTLLKNDPDNDEADSSRRKTGENDEFESVELRSRGKNRVKNRDDSSDSSGNRGGIVFHEHQIQKDDTLQNIAIRYSVTAMELKRINNLVSDQDFYGLTFLRIPINKYTSSTTISQSDMTNTVQQSNQTLSSTFKLSDKLVYLNDDDEKLVVRNSHENHCNKILSRVDINLHAAQTKNDQQNSGTDCRTGAFHFIDAGHPVSSSSFRTPCILICLLIFVFAVIPLLVTVYEQMFKTNGRD